MAIYRRRFATAIDAMSYRPSIPSSVTIAVMLATILIASKSYWRLSSRFSAYSAQVCPSTPGAPSLRVRWNASRSQSISIR